MALGRGARNIEEHRGDPKRRPGGAQGERSKRPNQQTVAREVPLAKAHQGARRRRLQREGAQVVRRRRARAAGRWRL